MSGSKWMRIASFVILPGVILIHFPIFSNMEFDEAYNILPLDWGDFFFLIEASLTFDGVFEMAPHPMYSVGYIGFYGTALITKSYTVLFVSLLAHAAQFAFLFFVENPHIEKTYNLVGPGKRGNTTLETLEKAQLNSQLI